MASPTAYVDKLIRECRTEAGARVHARESFRSMPWSAMPGSGVRSRSAGATAGAARPSVVAWLLVTAGDAGEAAEELAHARSDLATATATATAHAEQLQRALVSNRQIGMAMGILMERHRVTQEHAFDRLRDLSMRSNVKLRDVAEQIIYTGDTQQRPD
jgi:hypothetical protein